MRLKDRQRESCLLMLIQPEITAYNNNINLVQIPCHSLHFSLTLSIVWLEKASFILKRKKNQTNNTTHERMCLKVYCIRNSMLDHRLRALNLDQGRKPQEAPPAQHLKHHVNRTEVPARLTGALCHHGNRKKFQQIRPASGQDRHLKVCCSRYRPLNQPSAFLSQQLLSTSLLTYLLTYLVTGTSIWA